MEQKRGVRTQRWGWGRQVSFIRRNMEHVGENMYHFSGPSRALKGLFVVIMALGYTGCTYRYKYVHLETNISYILDIISEKDDG